ncbi:GNAT family N-acetyltransferase [Ahniella affigens]|uniref:GNAT family N-acetyltransferase n=1 Tax=Ahniella affigens TaxID=2021234 RepID=A0A2P1PUK8_9GAMM|nr:bifunctional helix-turn-helix transcriptional regulator/GNAT family N-acetyltransferase [Ahniella affigens]AVP98529.1 GNAT family N-acetyltransferase [Ahniella affigens]
MEFVSSLGYLALGSRLKAISDRLFALADQVYADHDIGLQARWFPILRLLQDRGPQSVGEIALAIGQTHAAVSQAADRLRAANMIRDRSDRKDRRVRKLGLTPSCEQALAQAKPAWQAIDAVLSENCAKQGIQLLRDLAQIESMLSETLAGEVGARVRQMQRRTVEIIPFSEADRQHFYRLNAEWLERYFYLEEIDHRVLNNPESEILDSGGTILYARLGSDIIGTCALKKDAPGTYELTKMAVTERYQGLGAGRKLIDAAIETFRQLGGQTLFLETHSKLESAIQLYLRSGFVIQPTGKPDSHYQRSNVYMIWSPGD